MHVDESIIEKANRRHEMNLKICRNCNAINTPRKRRCAECGGNRFDRMTEAQQADFDNERRERRERINRTAARLMAD